MKDSARRLVDGAVIVALAAGGLTIVACGRSDKTADVAQDSMLVKDADVAPEKTDTAGAATAALVRARGATPGMPALTNGAPVRRSADLPRVPASGVPTTSGGLQPPKRVNPSPVLPARESTAGRPTDPVTTSPLSPPRVIPPQPPTQPVSPQPQPVRQPSPIPKKDSSRDSLSALD